MATPDSLKELLRSGVVVLRKRAVDNTIDRFLRAPARMRPFILAGLLLIGFIAPASSAIYMKVDGITGEVLAEGYVGWIEVTSVQWGVGRGVTAPTGSTRDREASAPSFSEIATVKFADKTTPLLFREATIGEAKPVEFHFVKPSDGRLFTYQKIRLTDVMVSSFSQSSGSDRPTESLSLNYTRIELIYTPDNGGKPGTDVRFAYDLAAGRDF